MNDVEIGNWFIDLLAISDMNLSWRIFIWVKPQGKYSNYLSNKAEKRRKG